MDKKLAGKYAGVAGVVTLVITIICQIHNNGAIPWNWIIVLIAFILKEYTIQNVGMFIILKMSVQAFVNVMSLRIKENEQKIPKIT